MDPDSPLAERGPPSRACTATLPHLGFFFFSSFPSATSSDSINSPSHVQTHPLSRTVCAGSLTGIIGMATANHETARDAAAAAGPTRLLLTQLHPSVSAAHLRAHLERCPSPSAAATAVTDLKVLSRPDGTSRCIAFAGFKRHLDADRVREWVDGTWVAGDRGGARVKADWAKEVTARLDDLGLATRSEN